MIVGNLNIRSIWRIPVKTNAILVVDPNRVLSGSIFFQVMQVQSRPSAQIIQRVGGG
jgi:hypothetical protein